MNYSDIVKRPVFIGVLALVLGLVLGLVFAWGVWPVQWTDAPVSLLRQDLQEEYLRMSIDSYRVNNNETLALKRYNDLGDNAANLLAAVKATPGTIDPNFFSLYEQMISRSKPILPVPDPTAPTGTTSAPIGVSIAVILGGLLAIGLVGFAGFLFVRAFKNKNMQVFDFQPARRAASAPANASYSTENDFSPLVSAPKFDTKSANSNKQTIAHYVTTFVLGDDLFDDSFSIDSPSGEFLGECGVGISETVGVGDPKKVTAFEVWMFDKNDIQTVTKVLMSPYAFNDVSYRSRLEAKGELIDIESQKQIIMETQTLQMTATISDLQYGQGTMPNGSYFDRLTIELAIWIK